MITDNKQYAVAMGTFDGVHIGHKAVLSSVLGFNDLIPLAVTFSEPPKIYQGQDTPMLMTWEQKKQVLKDIGFKEILCLNYEEVHNYSAQKFLDKLFGKYNIKLISCGFNYRFGRDAEGNAQFLVDYCHEHGAETVVCPAVEYSGITVSSTYIRELIQNGDVAFANMFLNQPFSFKSTVIKGDRRGREIGYPTINQWPDKTLVIPKFGVYASKTVIEGKEYNSVTNIGIRPTFVLDSPLCETHIIDYDGNLYGKTIEVFLLRYLRREEKFNSLDKLKNAIQNDMENAKKTQYVDD